MQKRITKKKAAKKRTGKIVVDLEAESRECYAKADALLAFMDSPIVDFINDALVDAIADAGEMVGFPTPTYAPEETRAERRRMLADLLSQDSNIRLRKNGQEKVIHATLEILHNPKTPADLYEKVAEFVCDSMNEKQQHGRPMIAGILNSYSEDELRGAVIAAREEV